jgi:hypothetical protein
LEQADEIEPSDTRAIVAVNRQTGCARRIIRPEQRIDAYSTSEVLGWSPTGGL